MSWLSDLLTGNSSDKRAAERAKKTQEEQKANLLRVSKQAIQTGTPQQQQKAQRILSNKSWTVDNSFKPAYNNDPLKNATGTVGLGLYRSAVGTGQGLPGLYDLATPGKGTNRLSKALDVKAKRADEIAVQQNRSGLGYKGGQFLGDALTFTSGAPVIKGASTVLGTGAKMIPGASKVIAPTTNLVSKVSKPLTAVSTPVSKGIATTTAKLANNGAGGRIAAQAIQTGASKSQLMNTGVDMGLGLGQMASKGQDIGWKDVALQGGISAGFGVGLPATAQAVKEVIQPTTKLVTGMARGARNIDNSFNQKGSVRNPLVNPDGTPKIGKDPLEALKQEARNNGEVILYHRTSKANADQIAKTGKMYSKENTGEVFLSNRPDEQILGYGDTVVPIRVKKSDIRLDDEFPSGEQHFAAKSDRVKPVTDLYNQAKGAPIEKTNVLRDVPIADFKKTDITSWNEAVQNVSKGKFSKTNGPAEVVLTNNGYKLVEGNHRAVQALNKGDATIKAKVISKEGLDEIAKRDGPHIKMGMQDAYTQKQLDAHFSKSGAPIEKTPKTVRNDWLKEQIAKEKATPLPANWKPAPNDVSKENIIQGIQRKLQDAISPEMANNGYRPKHSELRKAAQQIYEDATRKAGVEPKSTVLNGNEPKLNGIERKITGNEPKITETAQKSGAPIEKTPSPFEKALPQATKKVPTKTNSGNDLPTTNQKVQSNPLSQSSNQLEKQKTAPIQPPKKPETNSRSYSNDTPELPEYNTKKVGLLDKAFRSTRSIIERQGESGKKLAGMLQGQRDSKEIWIRDIEKRIPTVQKLKGKEFENFVDATQGNAKPLNAKVEQAIKEWQSVHPEIRQRGVDAGLEIGDLGETYYPHFIDYDKIFKNQNTMNKAINHLVKTGQAETQEKAIELLHYARDVSRNRQFGNLESSRIIDLPFYDKTKSSLGAYLQGSADRITKAEVFGKGDEKALKLLKKIALEGGDTEAAKNAFDVAVGAKQYNPTASKISSGIRHYTTVTKLGLGALTNVSQSVNTGIVTGHMRTLGAIAKQLSPKVRQQSEDTGVISETILNDLRRGFGQETFGSSKLGKATNFITAPGFKQVESFNRRVAATAGRDYALRLAQKGDEATLRKLGVTGEIKNGTLTDAQQIQAARKIVEKTQFKVDAQDLPGWADSPGGKLVAQFRTFSYNQGKFFSNEILKPLARGNVLPAARLMAALPLGYALYETRRNIDGRPEEENKTKVALQSWGKVGGAGLVLDIYQGLNPVGSKYLPSDRRVSMAFGTLGGPSVGTAVNAVGAVSEAIQRKNTPKDESRLDGKVVVGKNEDSYTDLTAISRFGLQQVPIVGTATANRVLPYKKQAEADAGKSLTTKTKDPNAKLTLDESKGFVKKRIENAFGKEYAKMSQEDLKAIANDDQNAAEALQMYDANKGAFGAGAKLPDTLKSEPARKVLDRAARTTTEDWGNQKNNIKEVNESLKSWNNGKDLPEITNEVAKDWAEYQKDFAEGKISKMKADDKKKSILKKAYNSQLNEDEREIYKFSEADIKDGLSRGLLTEDNVKKALAVEKQLFDAKLITKESLAKKLDQPARGYKTSRSSGRSRSTGRRSSGGSRSSSSVFTPIPQSAYSMSGIYSQVSSKQKKLRDLLQAAKV